LFPSLFSSRLEFNFSEEQLRSPAVRVYDRPFSPPLFPPFLSVIPHFAFDLGLLNFKGRPTVLFFLSRFRERNSLSARPLGPFDEYSPERGAEGRYPPSRLILFFRPGRCSQNHITGIDLRNSTNSLWRLQVRLSLPPPLFLCESLRTRRKKCEFETGPREQALLSFLSFLFLSLFFFRTNALDATWMKREKEFGKEGDAPPPSLVLFLLPSLSAGWAGQIRRSFLTVAISRPCLEFVASKLRLLPPFSLFFSTEIGRPFVSLKMVDEMRAQVAIR